VSLSAASGTCLDTGSAAKLTQTQISHHRGGDVFGRIAIAIDRKFGAGSHPLRRRFAMQLRHFGRRQKFRRMLASFCRVLSQRGRVVASNPEIMRARMALQQREPALNELLLSTRSVPAERRLAFWREVVCQTIAGVEARALTARRSYDGRIRSRRVHLEHQRRFDLVHVVADPQCVVRTRELIDLQGEEAWLLMIQEQGSCSIHQGAQRSTLAPGDIAFLDTSRPYEVLFPQTFRQSILKVPTSLFNVIIPLRRDVAGMALAGADPLTAIARTNLLLFERFAHTINSALLPAAAERAIDHLGLAMRARLDDGPVRRNGGASARHFARASAYIIGHLRDSLLSVERVAGAVGLSTGHLHEVFHRVTGATVGDYIRNQRLERCRRDLADQSLRHHSITSIAHRWGFSEASSLSRAFRRAYQTSPRRYRQAGLRDVGAQTQIGSQATVVSKNPSLPTQVVT
jgi:AraC-like DNA-binding protein